MAKMPPKTHIIEVFSIGYRFALAKAYEKTKEFYAKPENTDLQITVKVNSVHHADQFVVTKKTVSGYKLQPVPAHITDAYIVFMLQREKWLHSDF